MVLLGALWGARTSHAGGRALYGMAGSLRPISTDHGRVLLHGVHDLPAAPQGIIELREYQLQPAGLKPYLQLLEEHIERRKQLSPLLGMFTCDTGGSLTSVLHLYHYRDLRHREEARAAAMQDAIWQRDMIDAGRHAGIVYQASSIIRHASYARFAAEFQFPPGLRSVAAFQPSGGRGGSGGSSQEGSTDAAAGKPTQPGRYVLAVHQPESWGPHGVDAITRMAALGRNARILWAHYGSELAFAGPVILGMQQLLELHRFRNSAALDACFSKLGSLNVKSSGYQSASTLRLLVPLPFSPWQ